MLTPKQEAFVLAYIETGNASEAYRRAYPASKSWKPEVVHVKASELLSNGKVVVRVDEIRGKVADKVVLDRVWVLERLMRNAKIAMGEEKVKLTVKSKDSEDTREVEVTDRDAAAANKALELLGKTDEVRLFADRIELSGKDGGPIETADVSPRDQFTRRIAGVAARLGAREADSQPNGRGH
jgi:phage terminase small subunit